MNGPVEKSGDIKVTSVSTTGKSATNLRPLTLKPRTASSATKWEIQKNAITAKPTADAI